MDLKAKSAEEFKHKAMPSAAVTLKYLVKLFGDLTISKCYNIYAKITISSHIPEVPGSSPGYPIVISLWQQETSQDLKTPHIMKMNFPH